MQKSKYKTNLKSENKFQKNSKTKQQSFFIPQNKFFGGALLEGKRKSTRPLSSKDAIHFIMRSCWACGRNSFLSRRNKKVVDLIITHFSKKFGVKIYERAINGNHIHLLLRITNRVLYKAFIKAITGKIASHVMSGQSFKLFSSLKENQDWGDGVRAAKKAEGFWEFRPFSRIVNWGRDFQICMRYLKQNILEALGFISYTVRKNYYSAWLKESIPDI